MIFDELDNFMMLHFGDIFIVNILDGIVGEQFCMSSWSTFTVNLENYAEILELMPNFLFTFKKLRSWYLHSMSFIHSREFLNLNLVAVKCLKMSRMKKMSHDERGHVNWKLKLYQFKGKDIIATTVLKFLVRFNILNTYFGQWVSRISLKQRRCRWKNI